MKGAEMPIMKTVGKFYVLDMLASSRDKVIVSGPFDTAEFAAKDMKGWNISEDCLVGKWTVSGWDTRPSIFVEGN